MVKLGIFQPDAPGHMPDLHTAERALRRSVDIVHWFHKIHQAPRPDHVRAVLDHDATPLLTWEPWGDIEALARGAGDDVARALGQALRPFGRQTPYIRIGHEMNGDWYPWSGNPDAFKRYWLRTAKTINTYAPWARFVWCVNRIYPGSSPIPQYWPGEDFVDAVGIDAYDMPHIVGNHRGPEELFGQTLECIRNFWRGPVWICETGSLAGAHRSAWIRDVKRWAEDNRIDALIYFNSTGSGDYRLTNSELAILGGP